MLLSDGHARLAADPLTAPVAELTAHLGWGGSVAVPLHRGGVVVGCLVLLLPASLTAPTKAELTAWSALGAHASVALADERLREQAATHAAELERHRLGRDLHDSVIAALFSLHTRAQAVRAGTGRRRRRGRPVGGSGSRGAGEARRSRSCGRWSPTCAVRGSSSADELPAALRELARACGERDGLRVQLRVEPAPGLAPVRPSTWCGSPARALHNCVKQPAPPERSSSGGPRVRVRLTVTDDGRGFDPAAGQAGGHGLETMREARCLRRRACRWTARWRPVPAWCAHPAARLIRRRAPGGAPLRCESLTWSRWRPAPASGLPAGPARPAASTPITAPSARNSASRPPGTTSSVMPCSDSARSG
jgi:hypothetical protein